MGMDILDIGPQGCTCISPRRDHRLFSISSFPGTRAQLFFLARKNTLENLSAQNGDGVDGAKDIVFAFEGVESRVCLDRELV